MHSFVFLAFERNIYYTFCLLIPKLSSRVFSPLELPSFQFVLIRLQTYQLDFGSAALHCFLGVFSGTLILLF